VGVNSLRSLTSGGSNTAVGVNALFNNNADGNTAMGFQALFKNTLGIENAALGFQALFSNTDGISNTAVGQRALASNTEGSFNTAIGAFALESNTPGGLEFPFGFENTAIGTGALQSNTVGGGNTGTGALALYRSISGSGNTATGDFALADTTFGSNNTADGFQALGARGSTFTTGDNNTAIGARALGFNTGSNNTALGEGAGSNLFGSNNNNIDIGNVGVAADNNTIRIGTLVVTPDSLGVEHPVHTRTFIAGIRGRATGVANAVPVLIDSNGQLGTASSSQRFKHDIKPMDKASDAILGLKPVTFHYKSDSTNTPQFGLIAEEVAKVNPDLVVRDEKSEIYTVRYDAVNAMLLNEFLKEHGKVQEQEATIAQLKSTVAKQEATAAHQQKQIEALSVGLQKVSAELEMSKPAPRVAKNNQ
jgi:uncharacterized coiled-coil protein SlyX